MIKCFCDRCNREILDNTGCCTVKRKSLIYENQEMTPGTLQEIPIILLCDRCECLLNKFLENKLDINYSPELRWEIR